jgi:hypothetical protein
MWDRMNWVTIKSPNADHSIMGFNNGEYLDEKYNRCRKISHTDVTRSLRPKLNHQRDSNSATESVSQSDSMSNLINRIGRHRLCRWVSYFSSNSVMQKLRQNALSQRVNLADNNSNMQPVARPVTSSDNYSVGKSPTQTKVQSDIKWIAQSGWN